MLTQPQVCSQMAVQKPLNLQVVILTHKTDSKHQPHSVRTEPVPEVAKAQLIFTVLSEISEWLA